MNEIPMNEMILDEISIPKKNIWFKNKDVKRYFKNFKTYSEFRFQNIYFFFIYFIK